MNANPLRAEFVVTGAATLAGALTLILAGGGRWSALDVTPGQGLLLLALALGAASLVGAVVVQVSFDVIGSRLRCEAVRHHLEGAFALEGRDPARAAPRETSGPPTLDDLLLRAHRSLRNGHPDVTDRAALQTVLSLGWSLLTPELAGEVEYRRSNRQVFLGVLPSLWLVVAAGAIAAHPSGIGLACLDTVIAVATAAAGTMALLRGARYQEHRAQGLLIDAVMTHKWELHAR